MFSIFLLLSIIVNGILLIGSMYIFFVVVPSTLKIVNIIKPFYDISSFTSWISPTIIGLMILFTFMFTFQILVFFKIKNS